MSATPRVPPTILATCCVPWHADFSFAEDLYCRQHLREFPLRLLPP